MPGIIHVVDDDASFRTATQRLLEAAGYRVITYSSAQQLLDEQPDDKIAGCILLDVQMPGLSGPELQSRLAEMGSTFPVIFLSGHADVSVTVKAIKAGADDFLIKPVTSDQLLSTIEKAIARHRIAQRLAKDIEALRDLLSSLTPRQRQVLDLIVRGKPNKQIAHALGSTERTVKAHRQVIMEKMKAQSLAQLVVIAERLSLLIK
ncbi:DNA-binding response regulator [Bradyrhizobium centrolobii]|uniref:DNA-binding response regulator n=1 Tax=Bradyrhizobium centrolobii TaxID=1505087 RepID=A0A176YKX9_9BRAD|nr:response regulator [Bradyrhizobium centrolobii]OAF07643.1 DNA-binding response regulator [Bradyrhizobium centrolobii]